MTNNLDNVKKAVVRTSYLDNVKFDPKQIRHHAKEDTAMTATPRIICINGSPKVGVGNTSQMTAMLRPHFERQGIAFEEHFLSQHQIRYCNGCGSCLEKGACWIRDDFKTLIRKVMAADALVLASPVYFFHVTAQMKTFIDRSLAFGHKPQDAWKPGLAVCVSAGSGETDTAGYLQHVMRAFGAYGIGALTAISAAPGQFVGKTAVEARAADLAADLARALERGERYPATDRDLQFWRFMGHLVYENRHFMAADHRHWETRGLYERFGAYVGQDTAPVNVDPAMRQAWLDSMRQPDPAPQQPKSTAPGARPHNLHTLLQFMPGHLNTAAAGDLEAVYQFEVNGDEDFTAHIHIAKGKARFNDGPASKPDLIIRSPAAIWMGISRGEIDGQTAFMEGRYTAEGDLNLLMRLPQLFASL